MAADSPSRRFNFLLSDYGMVLILFLLCAFFSASTIEVQHPTGPAASRQLASAIESKVDRGAQVLIVVRDLGEDAEFAEELRRSLEARDISVIETIRGEPVDARRGIVRLAEQGKHIDVFACNEITAGWSVYAPLIEQYPSMNGARVYKPEGYRWPNFLKTENLLNVANQIAVIAIIAIGMTMVIITGGIDLSVGSLIALSAVVTARLIRDLAGGESASALGMVLGSLGGILACTSSGLFTGLMVTAFRIPPFIVTLAMMLVASGLAYILADGQSINQVPDRFIRLGRGSDLPYLPNAVVLMLFLYALAHLVMGRTVLGRYIYAVGGNPEAARLSGVPTRNVLLKVYAISASLAGLGGVVMASQLKSGAPTYGQMYELYVIAAVVVGGTSLAGGEGKVLGTLIGAFIIAVIQNGMNLRGVESYTQKIVLGLVILGSVLLDQLRRRRGR
ncbi:ABC transporter permease [Tundrisphaera lichenicola]|uniref:ABC transporter permease n=1 Tax=Tundrisphaera lichenicola TaxID=2029860 RepID=UPI003EBAC66E